MLRYYVLNYIYKEECSIYIYKYFMFDGENNYRLSRWGRIRNITIAAVLSEKYICWIWWDPWNSISTGILLSFHFLWLLSDEGAKFQCCKYPKAIHNGLTSQWKSSRCWNFLTKPSHVLKLTCSTSAGSAKKSIASQTTNLPGKLTTRHLLGRIQEILLVVDRDTLPWIWNCQSNLGLETILLHVFLSLTNWSIEKKLVIWRLV